MRAELRLSLQFADARHRERLPRHRVARWIRAALAAPAQITVRIVDADEARALNRDYRGRDYATNVLSFPVDLPPGVRSPLLGVLVVCAPVVALEALAQDKPLAHHHAHLVVHGVLHLLGMDHERLTFKYQGREFRLTDVHGHIVKGLLA